MRPCRATALRATAASTVLFPVPGGPWTQKTSRAARARSTATRCSGLSVSRPSGGPLRLEARRLPAEEEVATSPGRSAVCRPPPRSPRRRHGRTSRRRRPGPAPAGRRGRSRAAAGRRPAGPGPVRRARPAPAPGGATSARRGRASTTSPGPNGFRHGSPPARASVTRKRPPRPTSSSVASSSPAERPRDSRSPWESWARSPASRSSSARRSSARSWRRCSKCSGPPGGVGGHAPPWLRRPARR